jgi:CheY-like chemotaxis protein
MLRSVEIINPTNDNIFSTNLIINIIEKKSSSNEIYFDIIFNNIELLSKKKEPIILTHELDSLVKSSLSITNELRKYYNDINICMLCDLTNEMNEILKKTKKTVIDDFCIDFKENEVLEDSRATNLISNLFEIVKIIKNFTNDVIVNYKLLKKKPFINKELKKNVIYDVFKFTNILYKFKNNNSLKIVMDICEGDENSDIESNLIVNIKILNFINIGEFMKNIYETVQFENFLQFENVENILCMKIILEVNNEKKVNKYILNNEHIDKIINIIHNKKIFILVDDSFVNLKILLMNLLKFLNIDSMQELKKLPKLTPNEWQDVGIILLNFEKFTIILLSNGMYGKEITLLLNPQVIITDVQMPLLNGIDMIKDLLQEDIKAKICVTSAYLNSFDEEAKKFLENNKIKHVEKNGNFDWLCEIFE